MLVLLWKQFSFYRMCSLRFENNFCNCRRCLFRLEKNFLSIKRVRFALKTTFFYLMCSLRFENNFLSIEHVHIASKIISLLSNVFALLWYRRKPHYRSFRSLSFRYRCHNYSIMGYSGAWVKLIHEKNWSKKSCDTVP